MGNSFTPKKLKVIELLATGDYTQVEIGRQLGINPKTITKYKTDKAFMQAVVDRSRALLKESLPSIYKTLSDKSKEGHDRHIKIFLDHLEKLEEAKSGQTAITFTWKKPKEEPEEEHE